MRGDSHFALALCKGGLFLAGIAGLLILAAFLFS